MNESSLPTADDSLAGQCQVEEGLAQLEGQRIFQCLTINDQRQLILLPQRVTQRRTVSCQCGTSSLQGHKDTERRVFLKSFSSKEDWPHVPLLHIINMLLLTSLYLHCLFKSAHHIKMWCERCDVYDEMFLASSEKLTSNAEHHH